MASEIVVRLTPDQIIERADARDQAWAYWAIFWVVLGVILGSAGTLLVVELWRRKHGA